MRTASIGRHAKDTPTVSLEDTAVVQAGAKAFAARGCGNCHGGPGVTWAKFSEGLRPDPPDLKDIAGELEPREIFYVIKNGINMTGMPSFARIEVGDPEIWTIVAFVKKLPAMWKPTTELDRSPRGCACRRACGKALRMKVNPQTIIARLVSDGTARAL